MIAKGPRLGAAPVRESCGKKKTVLPQAMDSELNESSWQRYWLLVTLQNTWIVIRRKRVIVRQTDDCHLDFKSLFGCYLKLKC
jgi:hypothetical protein